MHEGFDPYYKWLAIPPQEQPPHHYRLLAIPLFEADPEVIESAADQRMGHVRTFQAGRYGALSQQILNELAAARVCLLSREKKLAYDAELQAMLAPAPPLPPPPQAPVSTVLRSPPPPVGLAPTVPPMPSQGEIAARPAGSVLSRPAPVFPPLDSTLPDPTPPMVTASRKAASESRSLSLVVSSLGIALLASAAVAFWGLYSNQSAEDAVSTVGTQPIQTQPAPALTVQPEDHEDQGPEAARAVEEGASSEETPGPEVDVVAEADPEIDRDREPSVPSTMVEPEPAAEAPSSDDMITVPDEEPVPARPSLAEVLAEVVPGMEDSPDTADEPDELVENEGLRKQHVPTSRALKRIVQDLQPYRQADYSTLLVEAQKPERPVPHVYVLLEFAYEKAIQMHDANGALQAIGEIESRFTGDYDQRRVQALNILWLYWSKQRDARQCRALASVALQASRDALDADNRPLAEGLATVAIKAAKSSGNTAIERQVSDYLNAF